MLCGGIAQLDGSQHQKENFSNSRAEPGEASTDRGYSGHDEGNSYGRVLEDKNEGPHEFRSIYRE